MTTNESERQFTVDSSIIFHLIARQCGTVSKAIQEAYSNAVDAEATHVAITIEPDRITVADDGHGFRTEDEVIRCFEKFGFVHNDRKRTYGEFGLGRGQIMAFGATTWRTRTMQMDVDIKARGLDYSLTTGLPDAPGLTVTASLYEPLSQTAIHHALRDIETALKYALCEVTINGREIRKDPAEESWSIETDAAWIKAADRSVLSVYNQGVFVRDYSASEFGVGGTVVTKRGHPLLLNMARNDVVTHQCPIWKDVRKSLNQLAGDRMTSRSRRLTDADRDYLAAQTATGDSIEAFDQPIFTLSNGRNIKLEALLHWGMALASAPPGDRAADLLLSRRLAHVLSTTTLERFGASSVSQLLDVLEDRISLLPPTALGHRNLLRRIEEAREVAYDDIEDVPGFAQTRANVIPDAKLSAGQRLALAMLDRAGQTVCDVLADYRGTCTQRRKLVPGTSPACVAWTDGKTFIAIDEKALQRVAIGGPEIFLGAVHLLVHEYLHEEDDSGSHQHDHEFFEAFHEIILAYPSLQQTALTLWHTLFTRRERRNAKQCVAADRLHGSAPPLPLAG